MKAIAAEITDWQTRLSALQAAENAGDRAEAAHLRLALVGDRLSHRLNSTEQRYSRADLALLDRLILDAERLTLPDAALDLCTATRILCSRQGDRYGQFLFGMRGIHCCITRLGFDEAAAGLTRELAMGRTPLTDTDAALLIAANVGKEERDPAARALLQSTAMWTLGRYWATIGRLGDADRALCQTLAVLDFEPGPLTDAAEMALALGEIRIDRGDFAGFEELRRLWSERELPAAVTVKWQLLEATCLHLSGRLSTAEKHFRQLVARPQPIGLRDAVLAGGWQHIQVLATLNRLDEALAALYSLHSVDGASETATELLAALLRARGELPLDGPPSARQLLSRHPPTSETPFLSLKTPAVLRATLASGILPRTVERVRDEWTTLANSLQLLLHQGALNDAVAGLAGLDLWTRQLDSPLLRERLEYLWAIVAYYTGDFNTATARAEAAQQGFASLGMPIDEQSACRVLRWSRQRQEAPRAQIVAALERESHLKKILDGNLSPEDRVYYSLNKWTVVDEALSQRCHTLQAQDEELRGGGLRRVLQERRLHRLTLEALAEIAVLRSWDHENLAARPSNEEKGTFGPGGAALPADVLAWVREQLRLGRSAAKSVRIVPRWLPLRTALLYYLSLPDRLVLILVTRAGCRLIQLKERASRIRMRELARRAMRDIQYAETWSALQQKSALRELSLLLGLPAIAQQLGTKLQHLWIVPDDVLCQLPFAALPVAERPLVHHYTISILPQFRWSSRRRQGLARTSGLGVALERTQVQKADDSYEELAAAATELDSLAAAQVDLLPSLRNEEATRARTLQWLPQASLAHFACHGEFFSEQPHASGLVLYDKILSVSDLYSLSLQRLDLALLSACYSGNLAMLPGRQPIGISVAMLDRGAGAVLAALWRVYDKAGALFVETFYGIARNQEPATALSLSQRQWLDRDRPRVWASYVAHVRGVVPGWPFRLILEAQLFAQQVKTRVAQQLQGSRQQDADKLAPGPQYAGLPASSRAASPSDNAPHPGAPDRA